MQQHRRLFKQHIIYFLQEIQQSVKLVKSNLRLTDYSQKKKKSACGINRLLHMLKLQHIQAMTKFSFQAWENCSFETVSFLANKQIPAIKPEMGWMPNWLNQLIHPSTSNNFVCVNFDVVQFKPFIYCQLQKKCKKKIVKIYVLWLRRQDRRTDCLYVSECKIVLV